MGRVCLCIYKTFCEENWRYVDSVNNIHDKIFLVFLKGRQYKQKKKKKKKISLCGILRYKILGCQLVVAIFFVCIVFG